MTSDPRRVLSDAAQDRVPCEILPRQGGMVRASLVRVEKGGVVLTVPARRFSGGEDVRVWFAHGGRAWTFEASVIRAGVPVPDRSQDGILLGFLDRFSEGGPQVEGGQTGRLLELVPPNGPAISLLTAPARLVYLAMDGAAFTMPASFKLVWVQAGKVRVRLGAAGLPPISVSARVRYLSPEESYLLYDLHFEDVEDPDAHRRIVEALSSELG
jgi:hypothetical protein